MTQQAEQAFFITLLAGARIEFDGPTTDAIIITQGIVDMETLVSFMHPKLRIFPGL